MSITYAVTIQVKNPAHVVNWFKWMKDVHIPNVLATGFPLVGSGKICTKESLSETERRDEFFEVHYFFESREKLFEYRESFGSALALEYTGAGYGNTDGNEDGMAPVISRHIIVARASSTEIPIEKPIVLWSKKKFLLEPIGNAIPVPGTNTQRKLMPRAIKFLKKAHIHHWIELVLFTEISLLKLDKVGKKSVKEIQEIFAEQGVERNWNLEMYNDPLWSRTLDLFPGNFSCTKIPKLMESEAWCDFCEMASLFVQVDFVQTRDFIKKDSALFASKFFFNSRWTFYNSSLAQSLDKRKEYWIETVAKIQEIIKPYYLEQLGNLVDSLELE